MARTVDRLRVVVIRRRTQRHRELVAFQCGIEADRSGLGDRLAVAERLEAHGA